MSVVEAELELVVVGAVVVGDEAGVGELVAFGVFAEADAEGLDGFAHVAGHQRDDQARVEAAGEHRAERDVAHQPQPDGFLEQLEQPFAVLLRRRGCGRGRACG